MYHWNSKVHYINAVMKHEFLLLRVGPNDLEPETNDSEFIFPVTAVGFHGVQRRMISVDIFSYF